MADKNVNRIIPVKFDVAEQVDDRFTKVKITLMNIGLNKNRSIFSKEVIESALDTLKNCPILGFIEENSDGEIDFSDHRSTIKKQNGAWKIIYRCQAVGLIPEDHGATFETITDESGNEIEVLTCTGLIWRKWDDVNDILERDKKKSQSIEISENFSGHWNENGEWVFESFSFYGATILGSDYTPAMHGAQVEVQFSMDKIMEEIRKNLHEFNLVFNKKESKEGGKDVKDKQEILTKYNLTQEQLSDKGIDIEQYSVEELEQKVKEVFSLSAMQIMQELSIRLNPDPKVDDYGWKIFNLYYLDHNESTVLAESREDGWRKVFFEYTMDNDIPVINFESKKFAKMSWSAMESGVDSTFASKERMEYEVNVAKKVTEKETESKFSAQLEEANTKFTQLNEQFTTLESETNELKTEVTGLREFKLNADTEQRKEAVDELIAKFEQLTEDEVKDIREKAYAGEFTLEIAENTLFALVGKKLAKFSVTPKLKTNKIPIDNLNPTTTSGKGWEYLIEKHVPKD